MQSSHNVAFPSFELTAEKKLDSLNLNVQEFRHKTTGAQHIHLECDSEENVFLVALRTVPEDSTGVAHILEHTALCGSEKYPVRDPFFMMTRRSLNTFMNAFTSSDWTAYPLASLNKKDFNNLLDVYLDAVFFSRLDPLDFAQEGHRLEFQEAGDPNSPLEYKGVVFNEMKGAMSSVTSQLWQTMSKYLFPTSTYHHNSGGEPEAIPDLSYEQLQTFYQSHYHPSNAIFMTFGDIPAAEHQEKFEKQALHAFEKLDEQIEVTDEKRYYAPVKVQESYANDDDDLENKTHVVLAWLLGKSANLEDTLRAQLVSSVLLDHSASPLMQALETSDLGSAPSPLCGLDDSQKELSFMCGLSGTANDSSDEVEALLLNTLKTVAEQGVPISELEAALHQLELQQREVGGDSYPYGLQLILKALTGANHRADPAALLDLDTALLTLRKDIQDPNFVPNMIKEWLLDNPHQVRLTLVPDADISARKQRAERNKLDHIQSTLTESEKAFIVEQAAALKQRQDAEDDPSILPQVTLVDVPEKERSVSGKQLNSDSTPVHLYGAGTNGLVYQQVIYQLPQLDPLERDHLSLYGQSLSELGCGDTSYLDMQKRQNAVSGGISAFSTVRGDVRDINDCSGYYVYSGKALNANHPALSDLQHDIISSARFDEHSRMQEIVSQLRVGMEQSVTGSGHALAMTAASAGCSLMSQLNQYYSGLDAIKRIKTLDSQVNGANDVEAFANSLASIHTKITQQARQILVVGETHEIEHSAKHIAPLLSRTRLSHTRSNGDAFIGNSSADHGVFAPRQIKQAWVCNSQVNFCAKAYATVPLAHKDSAALVVLGHYLRNNYLHKTIREQGGAYGGGASQDNNGAAFRFYSYRDPRMAETLNDFDSAIQWMLSTSHKNDKLEEAILGTIGSLDRSESPAGQAKRCFHSELHGRTLDIRESFRAGVLKTSVDDLIRVTETYLQPDKASTAIVTGKDKIKDAEALGLEIIEL